MGLFLDHILGYIITVPSIIYYLLPVENEPDNNNDDDDDDYDNDEYGHYSTK